jgi:hypothetical protein
MRKLLVHVEGETEEAFVNFVLSPHLRERGYEAVTPRKLGKAFNRKGVPVWDIARKEFIRELWEKQGYLHTTMVDYYGMPTEEGKAWPGRGEAQRLEASKRAVHVEQAILKDLGESGWRFIPFVVMHEFEGLLFSDCHALAKTVDRPDLRSVFQNILAQADGNPEMINDSPETHPAERLKRLCSYKKPLHGRMAAEDIGIEAIRVACPHFASWIETLEHRR